MLAKTTNSSPFNNKNKTYLLDLYIYSSAYIHTQDDDDDDGRITHSLKRGTITRKRRAGKRVYTRVIPANLNERISLTHSRVILPIWTARCSSDYLARRKRRSRSLIFRLRFENFEIEDALTPPRATRALVRYSYTICRCARRD